VIQRAFVYFCRGFEFSLDQSERQALIRRSFLFKDVPQPILERLATLSVTKHLDRRETLFNRGDEGDALYAVVEGLVRIWVGSDSGKELTFSIMEPGDVLFFNGSTIHVSGPNKSTDRFRRSIIFHYLPHSTT
jgi:CRP-like cAMP-binding protein